MDIGPVLVRQLIELGHTIVGYDIGYFDDCFIASSAPDYEIITGDIRDLSNLDLTHYDAIIISRDCQ